MTDLQALNQFLVLYLGADRDYFRDKDLNLNEEVQFTLYNANRESSTSDITVTSVIEQRGISLSGRLKEVFKDGKLFILYLTKLSKDDDFYWQVTFQNNSQLSPSTTYLEVFHLSYSRKSSTLISHYSPSCCELRSSWSHLACFSSSIILSSTCPRIGFRFSRGSSRCYLQLLLPSTISFISSPSLHPIHFRNLLTIKVVSEFVLFMEFCGFLVCDLESVPESHQKRGSRAINPSVHAASHRSDSHLLRDCPQLLNRLRSYTNLRPPSFQLPRHQI